MSLSDPTVPDLYHKQLCIEYLNSEQCRVLYSITLGNMWKLLTNIIEVHSDESIRQWSFVSR